MKLLEYEETLQKRRSAFRGTGLLAWLIFPVQFAIGCWLTRQAELGNADPERPLFPILLVALSAILFFFLVKWMRWLQIIMFSLITFISFMFWIFRDRNGSSYQMSSMLLAIAMLSLPVVGLFYLGIRHVRKGRDAKNLPPMPGRISLFPTTISRGFSPEIICQRNTKTRKTHPFTFGGAFRIGICRFP